MGSGEDDERPEQIREYAGNLYDAVMGIVIRHDPLGLIKHGALQGEYALPVGTIVRRLYSEFTEPLTIVYEEFARWAQASGGMYERLLGPRENFRPLAEELERLRTGVPFRERWDRVDVHYHLWGEFDPEEIAAQIGIPPDRSRRKGERVSPVWPLPVIKQSYVQYDSGLAQTEPADAQLAALLRRLRPAWPVLVELGRRYEAWIDFVLRTDEGTGPPMGLTVEDMRALVELSAAVDVDIYGFT